MEENILCDGSSNEISDVLKHSAQHTRACTSPYRRPSTEEKILYDVFSNKFSDVLKRFAEDTEACTNPRSRPSHPMVVGIRGVMFAKKTGCALLLAHNLSDMGYSVLLLTPDKDTRDLKASDEMLANMDVIKSNSEDESVIGWTLNEELRLEEGDYIISSKTNPKDSTTPFKRGYKYRVEPRMSINRNDVTGLSLAVPEMDAFFFEQILRPQCEDDAEGVTYLLQTCGGEENVGGSVTKTIAPKDSVFRKTKFIPQVIVIDEFQFVSKENVRALIEIAYKKYGVHVIVSSLISDDQQKPFGYYKNIFHYMFYDIKLDRVCHKCSQRAAMFTKSYPKPDDDVGVKDHKDLDSSDNPKKHFPKNTYRLGSDCYYVVCNECYHDEINVLMNK